MNLKKNGKIFKIEYFSQHKNNEKWDILKKKKTKKNYRSCLEVEVERER